jgi:PKD repeat protein
MDQNKNSIEHIFNESLSQHEVVPSDKVIKGLKRKLFLSDFVSFNPMKFNIAYATIIIAGLAVLPFSLNKKEVAEEIAETKDILTHTDIQKNEEVSVTQSSTNEEKEGAAFEEMQSSSSFEVVANFTTNNISGCAPLSVDFKNTSKNATAFNWKFGDGNESQIKNPSHTFTKPGTYQIVLDATSNTNSMAQVVQAIEVFDNPTSSFTIDIKESSIQEKKVVFKNESKGATRFTWLFGDNQHSTNKNPVHNYDNYRSYKVMLIAENTRGCSDTAYFENNFISHDYSLVFPTSFKPNPASANNGMYERAEYEPFIFYPQNFGAQEYNLSVFATNGIEVFASNSIKIGWNGYIRGRMAPPGIYSYKASGIYPNGKAFSVSGEVKLEIDKSYDNFYNY